MQRKKIILTGANGLLGESFISLFHHEFEIHALVRRMPSTPMEGVKYLIIDLSKEWIDKDFPKDVDAIVHLSQPESFRDFPAKADDIFKVNIESTARLLDFAYKNKVTKFILASSGGVYGPGKNALNENSPIQPSQGLGFYLSSKLCSEIIAQNYSALMDVVILRFFFMYGKNQKRSMLLPRLMDDVSNGKAISIQGDAGIKITPIHVQDAAKAVMSSLELKGSHIFNIAGDEVVTIKELAEIMGYKLKKSPLFEKIAGEPQDLIADNEMMKRLLHRPQIKLDEGLQELIVK